MEGNYGVRIQQVIQPRGTPAKAQVKQCDKLERRTSRLLSASLCIWAVSCRWSAIYAPVTLVAAKSWKRSKPSPAQSLPSLEERCNELAQISNALVPPAPTRSGLNLNKRSLALQMFRRGEPPQEISGALSIPRNEVQLLIKVQQIVMSGVGAPV